MLRLPFGRFWIRTQSRLRWTACRRNSHRQLATAAVRLEDRTLLAVPVALSSDGGNVTEQSTNPTKVRVVNDRYLFTATMTGDGDQFSSPFLFASDGTAAGTGVIARTNDFGVMQNVAYFSSGDYLMADPVTSLDRGVTTLWRTDGTVVGTSIVTELASPLSLQGFYGFGNTLYFFAYNGSGLDLMKSDGTTAGTVTVKTGVASTGYQSVFSQTDVNGKYYFTIRDQAGNDTLWISDGTAAGTMSLKTFNKGTDGSAVSSLTSANGTLFFFASNGGVGRNLWKSDGTVGGTVQISTASQTASTIAVLNGTLFFQGSDVTFGNEIWSSDGTVAGTALFRDINPGAASSASGTFLTVGSNLYFGATDVDHGRELWVTDGTFAGTRMVVDVLPGSGSGASSVLAAFNSRIYFSGNTGGIGNELLSTDGTAAGTVLVKDIAIGGSSSSPGLAAVAGGKLLFFAFEPTVGRELWATDGTTAGTQLIKNLAPVRQTTQGLQTNPYGRTYGELNGTVYFSGAFGYLYRSDGLTTTTLSTSSVSPYNFVNFQGSLYYNAMSSGSLIVINGTGNVAVVAGAMAKAFPLTVIGNSLYYQLTGTSGTELWRTDGTAAGTVLVKSSFSSLTRPEFFVTDGVIYFTTTSGSSTTLWRTDGTAAGTSLGLTLYASSMFEQPFDLTPMGGLMYYIGRTPSSNIPQLMRTDGLGPGTYPVKSLEYLDGATELAAAGNKLFFTYGTLFSSNRELWVSDGTAAGTSFVTDIRPGTKGSRPNQFVAFNNKLFFSAFEPTYGRELWSSDGTAAGTQLVADVRPGNIGSNPSELAIVDGKLYFAADGGFLGRELWVTDGTTAGTRLYADVNPVLSSNPDDIIPFGSKPLLTAYTLSTDRELWSAYEPNAPANLTLSTSLVAENQSVGATVGTLTTVSNVSGAVYTLALVAGAGDTDNALFSIVGQALKTNAVFDYENRRNYTIRVRTTDQFGVSYERSMVIQVTDVNDPPSQVIMTPTVGTIPENTTGGGTVATFQIFDDALGTNSIGLSGPDVSAFNRIGNTIALKSTVVLDYELKTSYSVTLTVRDFSLPSSTWISIPFTLNVLDIDEFDVGNVTDTDPLPNEVSEAAASGTSVGLTASAVDADATNRLVTYSLINNAGGRFAIDSVSGAVKLIDPTQINFESSSSHVIVVRAASEDGSFKDQSFQINVVDVNEFGVGPIGDIDGATDRIAENAAIGANVGITAHAVDLDASSEQITYSLTDGAAGQFAIDAVTGVVTVANPALLNYETASSIAITVQAASTDGSLSTRTFLIRVDDIDEYDVSSINDLDLQTNAVSEDALAGTAVGLTAFASDADGSNSAVTYSLAQDSSGRFQIDPATGVVTVRVAGSLDYEQSQSSTIIVRATSADGSTTTQSYVIAIHDVNEFDVSVPGDVDVMSNTVLENAPTGVTTVGVTVLSIDLDGTTKAVTYSLMDDAGGRFAIQPDGVVVVDNGSLIDRESAASYSIIARATSEDGSFKDAVFVINVLDVDEFGLGVVSDTDPSPNEVLEGSANGTPIGVTGFAVDPDATAARPVYSLSANAGGRFKIDPVTGVVSVANGAILDREQAAAWSITVKATMPDGRTRLLAISIKLLDVSDSPVGTVNDANPAANSVRENAANGVPVGITAVAVDPDLSGNAVTYSLSANANGRFAIHPTTGVVTVAKSEWLDREAAAAWSITVKATSQDGSSSFKAYSIALEDVNEFVLSGMTDSNTAAANSVLENAANGTPVGITALASDRDATSNAVAYSLSANAGGRFTIHPTTGVITVANGALLDREQTWAWSLTVLATSADGSKNSKAFTIALGDVDEFDVGPVIDTSDVLNIIAENAVMGTAVGITARAVDKDGTLSGITYSLLDSAGGRFAIGTSTGIVTVAGPTLLDREGSGQPAWNITVKATSADGSTSQQVVTIQVTDVNEFAVGAVTDVNPTATAVAENSAAGTLVGLTARASDGDVSNNIVTYRLTNDAGGRFAIDLSTGVVRVAAGAVLDFEAAISHAITVEAAGSDGSTASQSFTIDVTNVSDAPRVTLSNNTIAENRPSGTVVGGLGVADLAVTSPVYTLVSGTGSTDNSKFSIFNNQLQARASFNFETKSSYSVRVQMRGASGVTLTQVFTIQVTNVNEAPTGLTLSTSTITENNAIGAAVGTIAGVDPDTGGVLNYTLVSGSGSTDNARFTIEGNELKAAEVFDYERKRSYSIRVRVTDAGGLFYEKTLSIKIANGPG